MKPLSTQSRTRVPELVLLLLTAGWGSTFVIIQAVLDEAPPQAFLTMRFAVAAAVLLVVGLIRGTLRDGLALRRGLLLGVALYAGLALQTEGLVHTTASRSAFITGLAVLLVPFLSWLLNGRRPALASWFGIALALGGLLVLTRPWTQAASGTWLGDLLTLGSTLGFACQIVGTERFARECSLEALVLPQLIVAAILSGIAMQFEAGSTIFSGEVILVVLLTAVLFTAVGFALMTWALQRTSATSAALIFALEPVFAALYAAVFLGLLLSKVELVGAALILTGVLVGEVGPAFVSPGRRAPAGIATE